MMMTKRKKRRKKPKHVEPERKSIRKPVGMAKEETPDPNPTTRGSHSAMGGKPYVEPKEDPTPAPEARTGRRRDREEHKEPETKKNRCPHGFVFGEDFDQYTECDTCDVIDDCEEANKK